MNRHGYRDNLNMDQAKNIVKELIKNSKSGEFFISSYYSINNLFKIFLKLL